MRKNKQNIMNAFFKKIIHFLCIINPYLWGVKFGRDSFLLPKAIIRRHKGTIKLGYNTRIYSNSRLQTIDKSSAIIIGNNTMIGYGFSCLSKGIINIGNECIVASNVFITDYNHSIDRNDKEGYKRLVQKTVRIGNNVWIGEKAIILPGVIVGNNSIIGAESVVTKSVPDNAVAVGNPAKVIKIWSDDKRIYEKPVNSFEDL